MTDFDKDTHNLSLVHGKIIDSREYQGKVYTTITLPSDGYAEKVETLEIRSDRSLGVKDDVINAAVKLTGWRRQFTRKDGGKAFDQSMALDCVS